MSGKKEYIERGALLDMIAGNTLETWGKGLDRAWWSHAVLVKDNFVRMLKDAPAADVVEVVRCKDCIHSVPLLDRLMCKRTARKSENGWFGLRATADKHFCSYGERKEQT